MRACYCCTKYGTVHESPVIGAIGHGEIGRKFRRVELLGDLHHDGARIGDRLQIQAAAENPGKIDRSVGDEGRATFRSPDRSP